MPDHNLLASLPEQLPEFELAIVQATDKAALKAVLAEAPKPSILLVKSDGRSLAKALKRIVKKYKFEGSSFIVEDINHTGEFFLVFSRGNVDVPQIPNIAYVGRTCLFPTYFAFGPILDVNCFGLNLHKRAKERDRFDSTVIVEEL